MAQINCITSFSTNKAKLSMMKKYALLNDTAKYFNFYIHNNIVVSMTILVLQKFTFKYTEYN